MMREFLKLPPAAQLNIIFFLILGIIVLFFYSKISMAFHLFIIYLSLPLFQVFLYKINNNKFISFLKNIGFPLFSILIAFDTIGHIIPHIKKDMDLIFLTLDYKILGFYPYLYLEKYYNPLLTEIMQISYCFYYFLPFLLGFYLIKKGSQEEFQKALFFVILCFYISYIGYLIFPALGPRFSLASVFKQELKGLFLADKINSLLNSLEGLKRDAFPSGHVGISFLILLMFYRYNKKIFWLTLFPVLLLMISTIYCRYHYFVDVLGGLILTVVTLLIGNLYYNFWLMKNGNTLNKR